MADKHSHKGLIMVFAQLGPKWVTAIAGLIVALTAAGFFAGTKAVSLEPQPTKTVTVTATPADPSSMQSPSAAASSSEISSSQGVRLGSYTFTLPSGGSAPLGPTPPTQAQILAGSGNDIIWYTGLGGSPLQAGGGDQIVSLPDGTTPTYKECKSDTLTAGSEGHNPGTAFCIIETTGRMAGVTVQTSNTSGQTWSLVLQVEIWTNSP